jgi:thiol:disulfide interchange protein DsbD
VLAGSGSEGSMARVLLMMAIFGVTCALPFVLLAMMPSKLQALPRSGVWMKELKVFLGFVEIAASLKFLSNAEYTFQLGLMPREVFLWLWALLLGAAGLYVLGVFRSHIAPASSRGPIRLAGASLTLLYAGWCGWGGLGAPLDEITDAIAPPYHSRALAFFARGSLHTIVKDDYDGARAKANAEHRWLLVNFTGFT